MDHRGAGRRDRGWWFGHHRRRLYSIGIPKDTVLKYEGAIKGGKFLLLAHGTADEVTCAKDTIQSPHPAEFGLHDLEVQKAAVARA